MKNIYHKIISSALIAACTVVLACGEDPDENRGMVWIPPTGPDGFWMGSSNAAAAHNYDPSPPYYATPEHSVTLSQGFWMSRYEITQEQFYSIMKNKPEYFVSGNRHPADGLSWYEAIVFCNRLSIKEGLSPVYSISGSTNPDDWGTIPTTSNATWNAVIMLGSYPDVPNGYRLPTEAEWEYACRAGTTSAWNTGNSIKTSQANYNGSFDSPPGDYKGSITPVGSYPPNVWGLYDMHGNVWEWCWDWYESYAGVSRVDPVGASSGTLRVLRSGCFSNSADGLRSAFRDNYNPSSRTGIFGFRVVRQ